MKPGSLYIKRVGAVAGDTVCVNSEVSIATPTPQGTQPPIGVWAQSLHGPNRRGVASRLTRLHASSSGDIFTIGDGLANSYDGRYYGLFRCR
ncbi:S26 family signal peptidase [Xanthomonas campestris]|uniref:S26 family signal peptidase n=1 Tax=Xanthomonas campestris TaxID=339 RepID=UPI000D358F50